MRRNIGVYPKHLHLLSIIKTIFSVVITQDKTIVSGHQRARACKELGIEEVKCEVREYNNEDDIILDLLDTNEKQRGTIGGSTIKLGRRIKEYERIHGIKKGNNQYNEESNNVGILSQEDLLKKLDLNKETYRQAKKLASLPQEIQDAVETGKISASFVRYLYC